MFPAREKIRTWGESIRPTDIIDRAVAAMQSRCVAQPAIQNAC